MSTSDYINECRRNYSLMVLTQRALPSFADGLTTAARRLLWVSRKLGKQKTAALAGSTLYLHPHAEPYDPAKTMAAKFTNNYPLLKGYGSWGTKLDPGGIASPRYTSVEVSQFAKDVVLVDLDLVEMVPNYDKTSIEPKHFLPLLPISLVNPFFGIAVGYASTILPRSVSHIVDSQIKHLEGKREHKQVPISVYPLQAVSVSGDQHPDNPHKTCWTFEGTFEHSGARKITITGLPYGKVHEEYRATLQTLKDAGVIRNFVDSSSEEISILVHLPTKAQLTEAGLDKKVKFETHQDILKHLELINTEWENLNVINPEQTGVMSLTYSEMIAQFTDWRLGYYKLRFEKLRDAAEQELLRKNDVLLAIENNANIQSSKCKNRETYKTWLKKLGVIDVDYISSLPTYRFTQEEKKKVIDDIKLTKKQIASLNAKIRSKAEQKKEYIADLREIKKMYK